jgi:hypothetical protein
MIEADGLHLTLWGHGELNWGFEVLEKGLGNWAILDFLTFLKAVGHHFEVFWLQVVLVLSLSGQLDFVFELESPMLVNSEPRQCVSLNLVCVGLANVPSWLLALLVGQTGPNHGQHTDYYFHCRRECYFSLAWKLEEFGLVKQSFD